MATPASFNANIHPIEQPATRMPRILPKLKHWLKPKPSASQRPHIIFLDGDCSFCQNSARILARFDHLPVLNFATLQGQTARQHLSDSDRTLVGKDRTPSGQAVLLENPGSSQEQRHTAFNAILRSLYLIGGPPALAYPLILLPEFIKSPTYNFIARHRHQIPFFKKSCPIPSPEAKTRHLP